MQLNLVAASRLGGGLFPGGVLAPYGGRPAPSVDVAADVVRIDEVSRVAVDV